MYVLKDTIEQSYPDFDRILRYIHLSNLQENTDARPLMATLKCIKATNPRLGGNMLTRRTALSSFDWVLKNVEKNIFDDELKKTLQYAIYSLLKTHTYTPLYGCYAASIEWSNFGVNKYKLPSINMVDVTQMLSFKKGVKIVDDDNILVYEGYNDNVDDINIITDTDDDKDQRGGILRSVIVLEKIRWDARVGNAETLTYMRGLLQIKNLATSDDKVAEAKAHEAAALAQTHKFIVTDDDIAFELQKIIDGDLGAYEKLETMIREDCTIAILGEPNTTQLPQTGGSRAALEVLQKIGADILFEDMTRTKMLIDRFLQIFWKANYGTTQCPIEFQFNWYEMQDLLKNADTASTIISAGIPVKKDELYRFIGFTQPEPADDVFIQNKTDNTF